MKIFLFMVLLLNCPFTGKCAAPNAGFSLPDSVFEFSMKYKTANNLIILPVIINDSIHVNLILDTGCRNLILFGKKFRDMFSTEAKPIQFSGLGEKKTLNGKLSLDNLISIDAITGNRIPIVIVPQRNIFSNYPAVDGIIGYEIFVKFEVELNFSKKMITFRRGSNPRISHDFNYVPIRVVDSKPWIPCKVMSGKYDETIEDLLIDTGSSLGLLLSAKEKIKDTKMISVGRGLSGLIEGIQVQTHRLFSNTMEFENVNTSLIYSDDHYASIGIDILKDYVVILNYCQSYAAFRKA
jgi:hypothetical protein